MCQDIADCLDKGVNIDAIIIDFTKAFNLVPHDRLLTKLEASGMDSRVVIWAREFLVGHRVRVGGQPIQGSQSNLRCATREHCELTKQL